MKAFGATGSPGDSCSCPDGNRSTTMRIRLATRSQLTEPCLECGRRRARPPITSIVLLLAALLLSICTAQVFSGTSRWSQGKQFPIKRCWGSIRVFSDDAPLPEGSPANPLHVIYRRTLYGWPYRIFESDEVSFDLMEGSARRTVMLPPQPGWLKYREFSIDCSLGLGSESSSIAGCVVDLKRLVWLALLCGGPAAVLSGTLLIGHRMRARRRFRTGRCPACAYPIRHDAGLPT